MINLPLKVYGNKSEEPVVVDDLYWFEENGVHRVDFCCYAVGHHEDFYVASSTGFLSGNDKTIYTGDLYYVAGTGDCVVSFDENEGFIFEACYGDDLPCQDDRKVSEVLMEGDLGQYKGSIYESFLKRV